jgi:hypothetical protein
MVIVLDVIQDYLHRHTSPNGFADIGCNLEIMDKFVSHEITCVKAQALSACVELPQTVYGFALMIVTS